MIDKEKIYTEEDIINFVEWITYTKEHGGVKPLQEAMVLYKAYSIKELLNIYMRDKKIKELLK